MIRLSVDIGARFADFCMTDGSSVRFSKHHVSQDLATTIVAGVTALDLSIQRISILRVATTQPLNAILNQRQEATALIVNEGFTDVLELARQDRCDLFDPMAKSGAPVFLVPPHSIFSTSARMDASGVEISPLSSKNLAALCARLQDQQVSSVAISLLHSHKNPEHEIAIANELQRVLPHLSLSMSHQVDPAPREYERTVATVLDAWLKASACPKIASMIEGLKDAGFQGQIEFGDSRGTIVDWKKVQQDPTALLAGSPAAVAISGCKLAPEGDAIVVDIGSKSADLCALNQGEPVMAGSGHIATIPLRRNSIDSISLPIGGACRVAQKEGLFQHGAGDAPLLDECFMAIGLFAPVAGAQAVPEDVARRLIVAASTYIAESVVRFATRRNIDPLRANLIISGGTGGLLAADIARAMGRTTAYLPQCPAAAGAAGLAMAPTRFEARVHLNAWMNDMSDDVLKAAFETLDHDVGTQSGGQSPSRYQLSIAPLEPMHPMTVSLTERPASCARLSETYVDIYETQNGIRPPGAGFIGSISGQRDEDPDIFEMQDTRLETEHGRVTFNTLAGLIHIPTGWTLKSANIGYMLEQRS